MAHPTYRHSLTALVVMLVAVGCTGIVESPRSHESDDGTDYGPPRRRDDVTFPPGTQEGATDIPAARPRLARLTHTQWENSVQELFGLTEPTGLLSELRPDTNTSTPFGNEAIKLEVDSSLWAGYQKVATSIADRVMTDSAVRTHILEGVGTGQDAAAVTAFVRSFGKSAFRRPLTNEEVASYVALYEEAPGFIPNQSAFVAGIGAIVEAMLQSPFFLYRIESSTDVVSGKIPLNSYEIASRLSYTLWDSMPDAALFAAADAGELIQPVKVAEQVRRMLDDPRAEATITHFHHVLFRTDKLESITIGSDFSSRVSAALKGNLAQEFDLDVKDKFLARSLGFRALIEEPTTFVNAELAQVYGLSGDFDTNSFKKVKLDAHRAGVFTQAPFLAMFANGNDTDPIRRGVEIAVRIACNTLGKPPDSIPPLSTAQGTTMREKVSNLTEAKGTVCAGCHKTTINRFGFPLENYDAIGGLRQTDHGKAVVTADSIPLDGNSVNVKDGVELSRALAASPQVHACYARNWIEAAYAREADPAGVDKPLVSRLSKASAEDGLSVKELLLRLVVSDAFLTRSTEELPEVQP